MLAQRAFVYAKACGLYARSFLGRRIKELSGVSSLAELENCIFGVSGGGESIDNAEKRLKRREREAIDKILRGFSRDGKNTPPLLSVLAQGDELSDKMPSDNFSGGSDSSDTNGTNAIEEIARKNREYYTALWAALQKTPRRDRALITRIITEEIRLKNALWALRLRIFYLMDETEAAPFLLDFKPPRENPLHKDALASFAFDPEEEKQWERWALYKFVNKPVPGQYWKLNVSYFQNQAALYLYQLTRRSFRQKLFSLDASCCFIKLKQFELEILTACAEAARLGMTGAEALSLLGIQ